MRLLACILFIFISFSSRGQHKHVVAEYQHIHEREREGGPSRCDCDYHQSRLVLKKDSSFVLEEIEGRLSPKVQFRNLGTWTIENDSMLVLHVTHAMSIVTGKDEAVQEYESNYIIDIHGQIQSGYSLLAEKWEGQGLVRTSQQTRQKR